MDNPALTIALALAAGMIVQALARHLRLPGIVLLLAAGVLLGPDVLNLVRPDSLGGALADLVGFGIAVILFEGGLSLDWRRLRKEAVVIRLLISLGAVITAAGGALAAWTILGWEWRPALLFGTLVIVTGPTVITPLLRRTKVRRNLETILVAEGLLIDAVGATVAVVALEMVTVPAGESLAHGFVDLPWRLVLGVLIGAAGGGLIALLLRVRRLVPEGLENIFTLSLALALYQGSNALVHETGIVSAVVAGLVVGNAGIHIKRELVEFKEQLTVMLIGLLFVLLAADVRHAEAMELGWPGLLVVLVLMFVVRPLNVLACTWRSNLEWREKAFLAWLAPRGIVAAAVATLFDTRLSEAGHAGGQDMRALVFLVIAVTVLFQGATGGPVARLLRVRRPSGLGYAILGSNPLGRLLGRLLRGSGQEVVFIDADADACRLAREDGASAVCGNALEERVLLMADVEARKAVVGLLPNGAVNLLFARKAREEFKVPRAYVGIQRDYGALNSEMVDEAGATVLFGEEADLELWSVRVRRGLVTVETWEPEDDSTGITDEDDQHIRLPKEARNLLLPLAITKGVTIAPLDDQARVRQGDRVHWALFEEQGGRARAWLREWGWRPSAPGDEESH